MKSKRRLAAALLFAMLLPFLQPADVTAYAAPKNFTYAEQNTGVSVQSLTLEPGEKVDLKFLGVSDYKKYKNEWKSSNEKVATVSSSGVITAKAVGKTIVTLTVGDGKNYTSKGVTVTVAKKGTVSLGTSSSKTFETAELTLGKTMDLGFYGVNDWSANRYKCSWVSTNPLVATVDQKGIVTPVSEGTTYIILLITDKFTSTSLNVNPVTLTVVKNASPTPTPTLHPGVTVAPTATPIPVAETYTVSVTSTDSIHVKFSTRVNYSKNDIRFYNVSGSSATEQDFTVSWNEAGSEAVITSTSNFSDGEKYRIQFGSSDKGTTFTTEFGQVDRVELLYECMGKENTAYAWASSGVDMPVTFSYRLYAGNVDVTSEYKYNCSVEYELASPKEADYLSFSDDTLYFYEAGRSAMVRAIITYTENGKTRTLKSTAKTITAKSTDAYTIRADKWTIVDADNWDVDWSNPNHKITENTSGAQIVLLLTDMFGIKYSTDYRGVKESDEIYAIDDPAKFFANSGYALEFTSGNEEVCSVGSDGTISIYENSGKVTVSVMLENYNDIEYRSKKIGTMTVQIQDAPKLNNIKAEKTSVTLASDCLVGYESRFCEADIEINLFDQYNDVWTGSCELTAKCSNENVPVNLTGTTLHINAADLVAQNLTSVTFTITEPNIKKSTSVRVSLVKPTYEKDTTIIQESGWRVSANNVSVSFEDNSYVKSSKVELIRQSRTVDVGLYTANYVEERIFRPTSTTQEGVYVVITDQGGDPVPQANGSNAPGVSLEGDCLLVNVVGIGSDGIEFLDSGKYKIKAYLVEYDENGKQEVTTKDASFTVTNNVSVVDLKSMRGNETSTYVASEDDLSGVAEIIEELFVFTKDGKSFKVTADMVESATITWRERYVVIKNVELRIPIGNSGYSYIQKLRGLNKSVYHGVSDYD